MTWIGGIFSKANTSWDDLRKKVAVMTETACPANESWNVTCPYRVSSILDEPRGQALAKVSLSVRGRPAEDIYTYYPEKLALVYDGHLYGLRDTVAELPGVQHRVNETDARSLVHLLAESAANLEQRVSRALIDLDGDYALAVSDTNQIVVSRDRSGTRPLYFGQNNRLAAFASNKKPLWKIGLGKVRPLRAGNFALFDHEGVTVGKVSSVRKKSIEIKNMAQAVNAYEQSLCSAVRKRLAKVGPIRKVGLLLSGGVDSCLLAKLVRDAASSLGMETIVFSVGLPGSPDMDFAKEFARELGMRHKMKILSVDAVGEYIPKVIEAIEDSDFVQVETGIGLYAAIDMASQDGISVLFSGQGPDELWGGYTWYPKVLGRDGRHELCRRMREDFTRVDIETLDRENKIAMAHGVELFFPYLDAEVVNVAMIVASELKVSSAEDRLGKHPHRRLAIKMGISEKYANREKLAIQHGTGIHNVLDDIARKNGFGPCLVKDIGYKSKEITTEKMGSSARYGYRYTDKRLWQVPQHVQLFFQALAYRKGLLDKSVWDRVGHFLEKAGIPPES